MQQPKSPLPTTITQHLSSSQPQGILVKPDSIIKNNGRPCIVQAKQDKTRISSRNPTNQSMANHWKTKTHRKSSQFLHSTWSCTKKQTQKNTSIINQFFWQTAKGRDPKASTRRAFCAPSSPSQLRPCLGDFQDVTCASSGKVGATCRDGCSRDTGGSYCRWIAPWSFWLLGWTSGFCSFWEMKRNFKKKNTLITRAQNLF